MLQQDGLGQMSQTAPNRPIQMSQTVPTKINCLSWDGLEQFGTVWDGLGQILFECLGTDWIDLLTVLEEYYFPMNSGIMFIVHGYHCSNFEIALP